MNTYEPNQEVILGAVFVPPDGSDLDPPSEAKLAWRTPQGTRYEVLVTTDTPGEFEYTLNATLSGFWRFRWWTEEDNGGFVVEDGEGVFYVHYSEVVG